MFNLKKLDDDSILICPSIVRNFLLRTFHANNPKIRVKYFDKAELLNGLGYRYDYDAVLYLHDTYNLSYINAEEVLRNLISREFSTDKTKLIKGYYDDLIEHRLLKFNPLFKHIFKDKKVFVYGYSQEDLELVSCLRRVCYNFTFLENTSHSYSHSYYEFETMDEEVLFVFNDIMAKLNMGIDLNRIHLMSYSSDYENIIRKYAEYFKMPIIYNDKNYLVDSPLFKEFLLLLETQELITAYHYLKEKTVNDPFDAVGIIANILNNISSFDLEKNRFIELCSYIASTTSLNSIKYDHAITIVDENSIIPEDDYVYILGFSLGSYPRISRDVDFYSDKEKKAIGLNTSQNESKILEERLTNFIHNTKNLIITHKKKYGKTVFYPSLLVEKLNIKKVNLPLSNERFNLKMTEIESAIAKDSYRLYGVKNSQLITFTDDEIGYMNYDHRFKGLMNYDGEKKLFLSYSQINEYNQCPFQYFIKRVLKANVFEDRFTTELGNIYHLILEDSAKKDVNLNDYDSYIKDHFKTAKDVFFLNLLLPQVFKVIEKNKEFVKFSYFRKVEVEKELTINIDENTVLNGKIDKILFDENDQSLIVVDYKTGGFHFTPEKLKYGIDLQLPIYSYLISQKYPDYYNLGMYIQNVCLDRKHLADKKTEPYLLTGLTANSLAKIKRLDPTLGNRYDDEGKLMPSSNFITGITMTKAGELSKKSHVTEEVEYKEYKDIAIRKIQETIEAIRKGHFDISPIRFVQDASVEFSTGQTLCDRCSCKSICFMKDSDIRLYDYNAKPGEGQ